MDSSARIDYALFHLTPTRTRCELVIFANGQSEKLASGLLQPFLLHLKCAKEQIEKGGYSITLRPPAPAAWFTKGTLQRFVRFISSPDVLERFVTIEKEIQQIEDSIRSNEIACEGVDANGKEVSADEIHKKMSSVSELHDEIKETDHTAKEEHFKVRLRRVLESRKVVLHKEQAMAYARALVTGFQTDHLDALMLFANAFGASRLRKACYNFIELCKKKNQDRLWIAEVAAMQASSQSKLSYSRTSEIVLVNDENGNDVHLPASDQVEGNGMPHPFDPWTNNYPQYFHNYYGPVHPPNIPPYQGYPYPGMYVGNPYFPGNMVTDSGHFKSSDGKMKNSARKKEKLYRGKVLDTSEEDVISGSRSSSESASEEGVDGGKKHSLKTKSRRENGKKSSKRVMIRNINYISSKKDGSYVESSSDDEELVDGDLIKQQIEEVVGSLHRHQRQKKQMGSKYATVVNGSNGFNLRNPDTKEIDGEKMSENWGAFQSILMRDQETNTNTLNKVQIENDIVISDNSKGSVLSRQQIAESDSFVVSRDDISHEDRMLTGKFDAGDSFRPCAKKSNGTDEMMMLSRGNEEQRNFIRTTQTDYAALSIIVNSKFEEDWYVNTGKKGPSYPDNSLNQKVLEDEVTSSINSWGRVNTGKNDIVDDSFMVHSCNHQHSSDSRTDLTMVLDFGVEMPQQNDAGEKLHDEHESTGTFEPDDLYMIPDRSYSHEPFWASCTPEIDYENIIKVSETDKNHPSGEPNAEDDETAHVKGKGAVRSKSSIGPLGKSKSEILSRSRKPSPLKKSKQDLEEDRRLRMEEIIIQRQKRIAERKSNIVTSATLKKNTKEIKRSIKSEKPQIKSVVQDKQRIMKSTTTDRLPTARISKYNSEAPSKTSQSKKATPKAAGEPKKSGGNGTKKLAPSMEKEKPSPKKSSRSTLNGALTSKVVSSEKVDTAEIGTLPLMEIVYPPAPTPTPTPTIKSQTNGKNPEDLEIFISDNSNKKESVVLPVEVAFSSAPAPAIDDTEEVKEFWTGVMLDDNKEKVFSHSKVDVSTDVVAAEEKTTSDSEPSHPKALDQGMAEQYLTENANNTVIKSPSVGTLAKDTDTLPPNTKKAKTPSVTFSPTTIVSEIPASTPIDIKFSPELIPSRKKSANNDYSNSNTAKVVKGLKKLLVFGRKGRPISYA